MPARDELTELGQRVLSAALKEVVAYLDRNKPVIRVSSDEPDRPKTVKASEAWPRAFKARQGL